MHPFEEHIKNTVESRGLLRLSSPVLVALSGGADSVALLSVLVSLGYDCVAAHCNFHLRGSESVRDMRHAQEVSRRLGVNIYVRDFNVKERMAHTGESVEMACRSLRYAWFDDLLDRDRFQAIAVAHHREDNIETFFINLFRSAGLPGLTGMDFRRRYVVRPMLDVSRRDIENYLADKGLEYVIDSTNAQNVFLRNRLRNVFLPDLEENFPGALNAVESVMSHLRDANRLLDYLVEKDTALYRRESGKYDVKALLDDHGAEQGIRLMYAMLKNVGLNASQVSDIARAVSDGATGLRFPIGNDTFAELDRGVLSLLTSFDVHNNDIHTVTLKRDVLTPVHIAVTHHDVAEFCPERDNTVMYLDVRAIGGDATFAIRHPRRGDRIRPYGMNGSRLVSDILKDAKLSAADKRRVWVLTRNDIILWIIGIRAAAHFSVGPKTRRYLRLKAD